jgi:tRNA (guanine26-N2/guanine27-N2)-dimethyltransferase
MTIREFTKVRQEEIAAKGKREFKGISILEALAATGLRSVRYLKEIDHIVKLVANDIDPTATELMKKNFDYNQIPSEGGPYEIHTEDAIDLMNTMRKEKRFFDVIDLDPYGTAVPFLESAIQSIADGGLLCVTFTDMAVLCARNPHVCFYKYGAAPLSKNYCHELALRIVLKMISEMANRQQKYIEPLMSLTVDFYVRLFIRVKEGAKQCHESITKYSHVFQCLECEAHYTHPMGIHYVEETHFDDKGKKTGRVKHPKGQKMEEDKHDEVGGADDGTTSVSREKYKLPQFKLPSCCIVCDGALVMGGPIWNDKIHNVDFVKRLLESVRLNQEGQNGPHKVKTHERITAILSAIIDESYLESTPLSYDMSHIASTLKIVNPRKTQMIAAFNSLGYLICQTYYDPKLYKTNAPPEVIYDIFKAWKT